MFLARTQSGQIPLHGALCVFQVSIANTKKTLISLREVPQAPADSDGMNFENGRA